MVATGLLGLAFGLYYGVWEDGSPRAGFFPALSGGALCVFGAVMALVESTASRPSATANADRSPLRRMLGYMVGLLAFASLMEPVGAIPVIVLLFLWILAVVERLPWRLVLAVTAGSSFGAWLLFERILQVPLPRGLFG